MVLIQKLIWLKFQDWPKYYLLNSLPWFYDFVIVILFTVFGKFWGVLLSVFGWKSFFKSMVTRWSTVASGVCCPTPAERGTVVAEVPEFTQIDLIQVTCASINQSFWSWELIGCCYWSYLSTCPPPDWGGHVHPMLDRMTLRWRFSQRKSWKLNLRMETDLVGRE